MKRTIPTKRQGISLFYLKNLFRTNVLCFYLLKKIYTYILKYLKKKFYLRM